MRAGKLRNKIEIHSYTSTVDDFGQSVKTYALSQTVWAEAMPISGSEAETGGKYESSTIYQFSMRYTALARTDRIVFNGQNFAIFEILNVGGRNTELKVKAVLDE